MPYTTKTSDGKVTVSKKVGGHSKVVGHTTPGKKNAYLAALHIHSKDDKAKKENKDGSLSEIYGVQKPYSGCEMSSLVVPIDPLRGLSQGQIVPDAMHGVYADRIMADKIAEQLFQEYTQYEQKLEEKKGTVVKKIQTTINKLEKQRKEAMSRIMATPRESSFHKERVAKLTSKIEDLVSKMEKISKSQKEPVDVESKKAETKKDKK